MSWDHCYRPLKEGGIVQPGDEVMNDDCTWSPATHAFGRPSPDPAYTSHRWFRPLKGATP